MRNTQPNNTEATANMASKHSVNNLSTDILRATLINWSCQEAVNNSISSSAGTLAINLPKMQTKSAIMPSDVPAFLSKLLLPLVIVFVLATCGTVTLKADGRDEEGYIHKPKLVLWEEYYREWLDIEHQRMYGRPWDPNNPGDPMFFYNPDSVMVDVNWGECDAEYSPINVVPPVPQLPLWFKDGIDLYLDWNLIPRPEIYEDNRVIRYTINDILPKYKETIEGFKQLEKIVGSFYFEDRHTMYPDTTVYVPGQQAKLSRVLSIVFDNYVFDAHHGQELDLQESKYGLIDIEKALGKIEFVQTPVVGHRLGGHNPIFHTGIIDNVNNNLFHLLVSPIITADNITLSLPENLTIYPKSIQIVDSTGKTVKLFSTGIDSQQVIDVSSLPAGRYFVQIENYIGSFIVR